MSDTDEITPKTATDDEVTLDIDDYEELQAAANGEHRHTVSESADKIVLTTNIKRGTGTRDEHKIRVKAKGNDPAEAAQKLHETVVEVGDNGTINALAGTRPTSQDGDHE